jgi:hypothetical protein
MWGSKKAEREAQQAERTVVRDQLRQSGERNRAKALAQIAEAQRQLAHPTSRYPDPAAEREAIRQGQDMLFCAEQALRLSRNR